MHLHADKLVTNSFEYNQQEKYSQYIFEIMIRYTLRTLYLSFRTSIIIDMTLEILYFITQTTQLIRGNHGTCYRITDPDIP